MTKGIADPIWDSQFAQTREERRVCCRWALIIKSYKVNRMWPDRPNYQIEHCMALREKYLDMVGHPPLAFALAYIEYMARVAIIAPILGEQAMFRLLYRDFRTGVLPTRTEVSS